MIKRRSFFLHLVGTAFDTIEEIRGIKPHLVLSELHTLPNEKIRKIIPKIQRDVAYLSKDGWIVYRDEKANIEESIYKLNPIEQAIFAQFSGLKNIDQISHEIAEKYKLEIDKATQMTENLFLHLVKYFVCIPANLI